MQQYKKILGKVMMTAEGTYDSNKEYDPISLITDEETGKSYISRKEVPAGTQINNREYWQPVASSGIIDNGVIILNRKNSDGQVPIYDLKSAAEAVTIGDRKGGVILGFLGFNPETDTVPTWKLYQYNDVSPSNWTNIDYWLPMDYTNKYAGWFDNEEALYDSVPFPKVGMYAYVGTSASSAVVYRCYNDKVWQPTEDKAFSGVVNLADEEDITSKQNKLKFKDKEYNPAQYNGLGRIYLRKNMIDGKNILTQEMIEATNTIYIIQYDYDLQGQTITIPEGCILDFQGGSFSNGSIVGNNTAIQASLVKIFGLDIELTGTWNVEETYPEWFGAVGDGKTDDYRAIQKVIDFACISKILKVVLSSFYLVNTMIDCTNTRQNNTITRDGLEIIGRVQHNYVGFIANTGPRKACIDVTGSQWLKLKNFRIDNFGDNPSDVCIYQGIGKILPQTQNQLFESLRIYSNNYGIVNFGAEENTYSKIYISSRNSFIITSENPDIVDSYVSQLTSHSIGVTNFRGECFIQNTNQNKPVFHIINTNSLNLDGVYINGGSEAFFIQGGNVNFKYHVTIEATKRIFNLQGSIENSEIYATYSLDADASFPFIYINSQNSVKINNSIIKIFTNRNDTKKLFELYNTSNDIHKIYPSIKSTTIYTDTNSSLCRVPGRLLFNTIDLKICSINETTIYKNGSISEVVNQRLKNLNIPDNEFIYIGSLLFGLDYHLNNINQVAFKTNFKITSTNGASFLSSNNLVDRFTELEFIFARSNTGEIVVKSREVKYDEVATFGSNAKYCVFTFKYKYVNNSRIDIYLKSDIIKYVNILPTVESLTSFYSPIVFTSYDNIENNVDGLSNLISSVPINKNSGTTGERPNAVYIKTGHMYFDTTLNKPVYWTGTKWVDATGTEV